MAMAVDDDAQRRGSCSSSGSGDAAGGGVIARAREELTQGHYSDVVRACKQLLKQDRGNEEAYVVLGLALLRSGRHLDQAEMSFRRATLLNPSFLSAWQGLVEYCEVIGDVAKLVDASKQAAMIALSLGESVEYNKYMQKLAGAYAKLSRHLEAQATWQELRTSPMVSQPIKLEAIRGLVDSSVALMEELIQQDYKMLVGQVDASNHDLPSIDDKAAYREAEIRYACSENAKVLELLLEEIITDFPFAQQYHTFLFTLFRRKLLALSASSGQELKTAKIKLFQHSLATLCLCHSMEAMEFVFAIVEEDDLESLFSDLQVQDLKQSRYDRKACILWLGVHTAHIYPANNFSFAAIAATSSRCYSVDGQTFHNGQARLDTHSISGWKFLAELQVRDEAFESATVSIQQGLQAISYLRHMYGLSLKTAELQLHVLLARTLHSRNCISEAKENFQRLLQDAQGLQGKEGLAIAVSIMEDMTKIYLAEDNREEALLKLNCILSYDSDNHWALVELGWLEFQKGLLHEAIDKLEKAIKLCPSVAMYHYRLGLLYWKAGEDSQLSKEKARRSLLQAAKLNPSQPGLFNHLGFLYRDFGDVRRSIRCFQKAVSFNAEDGEAGEALCDALYAGDQDILLTAICRETSQRSVHAFWAWRHLGFQQVNQKDWSEAVVSLQYALRGYPKDAELWEALGLAYQQLGMLTASLKAYGRVLTLGSSTILFSLLQSGNILLSLASYQKAIDMFRVTLDIAPNLLGAKYGLAASLLGCARECIGQAAYGWGAGLLEEASKLTSHCAQVFGSTIGVWKLWGDIEVEYAQALPCELWHSYTEVSVQPDVIRTMLSFWDAKRRNAAKRAVKAYQHAVHLQPSHAVLYADLGIAFKLLHSFSKAGHGSSCQRFPAEIAVCGGLHLEPDNPEMWVMFGMLNEHRGIQQHAYIQALRLDGNHAVSWAQLGQLYLKEGDHDLAKQSFERARAADPRLALPWAGMSVIHSLVDRYLDLEEAFASCSYATSLSSSVSFRLGLAKIGAETKQLCPPQVYAAIHQTVLHSPNRLEALNLLGLACESRGLMETAIRSFYLARLICTALEDGTPLLRSSNYLAKISLNLARVSLKAGNYTAAVREYHDLHTAGHLMTEPEAQQCFALSLWKSGHPSEGLQTARQACEVTSLGTRQYTAAVRLLCQFLYHLSGPLSTLEEIWKLPNEVYNDESFVFTAMAIAITAERNDSMKLLLQKCPALLKIEHAPVTHALLAAGKQSMQIDYESQDAVGAFTEKNQSSLTCLIKALHLYPHSALLRLQLGRSILRFSKGLKASFATRCTLSCALNRYEATTNNLLYNTLADAVLACSACSSLQPTLTMSGCFLNGKYQASLLQILQRWLHREPWNLMAKYALIVTMMQLGREQRFPYQLCESMSRISDTALAMLPMQDGPVALYVSVQLLLCASECSLKNQDVAKAIELAMKALRLKPYPKNISHVFLQLARCYGLKQDNPSQHLELKNWQSHSSGDDVLGQLLSVDLQLPNTSSYQKIDIVAKMKHTILENTSGDKFVWLALLQLLLAHALIQDGDLLAAEKSAAEASEVWHGSSELNLFHGCICMELVKLGFSVYGSLAINGLKKASLGEQGGMPIANALLAEAYASKASWTNSRLDLWESYVRKAWTAWPTDTRPAEIYFQMGLLSKQATGSSQSQAVHPGISQSARSWVQKAVHLNPTCHKYWATLDQLKIATMSVG